MRSALFTSPLSPIMTSASDVAMYSIISSPSPIMTENITMEPVSPSTSIWNMPSIPTMVVPTFSSPIMATTMAPSATDSPSSVALPTTRNGGCWARATVRGSDASRAMTLSRVTILVMVIPSSRCNLAVESWVGEIADRRAGGPPGRRREAVLCVWWTASLGYRVPGSRDLPCALVLPYFRDTGLVPAYRVEGVLLNSRVSPSVRMMVTI